MNYKTAITAGFESLINYSLSTRTILSVHEKLLPVGGGIFRTQQNHIASGSKIIYTPPAAQQIPSLISNWENYAHE